ncbi:MAG: hypothetical protein HC904_13065 [Blastochloris sp.]|nr:hypothetical protein [Blastochloris sp.]
MSSGTWSLMGRELKEPVLSKEAFENGFSNEGAVLGRTRFLKNIAGMWLLQECKRHWDAGGSTLDYADLVRLAGQEELATAWLDVDAPDFTAPENMPEAIVAYCQKNKIPVPTTPGQFTRLILESLAHKYAEVKVALEKVTERKVERIHIVGGGSLNGLLNQLAADRTGCEVVAGPVEATSLGNILMQMVADGELESLRAGRELVARSFQVQVFKPAPVI